MRSATIRSAMLVCAVVRGAHARDVYAQGVAPKPLGPRTLSGVVTDAGGERLSDVDVFVAQLKKKARTGDDGTFRFDDVRPGAYDVGARRRDFAVSPRSVRVGADGGSVYLQMVRVAHSMLSVQSTTAQRGLSGVIGDTSFQAIAGARIHVVGSDARAQTSHDGTFLLPLQPGRYLVEVAYPSFAQQLIGVTVPVDSGRRLNVWLSPHQGPADSLNSEPLVALSARLITAHPKRSHFFTNEDLVRQGIVELEHLPLTVPIAQRGDCRAVINGGPGMRPLWQLREADVAFVEMYSDADGPTGTLRNTSVGAPLSPSKNYKYSTRINDLPKGDEAKPRDGSLPRDARCPGVRIGVWLRD